MGDVPAPVPRKEGGDVEDLPPGAHAIEEPRPIGSEVADVVVLAAGAHPVGGGAGVEGLELGALPAPPPLVQPPNVPLEHAVEEGIHFHELENPVRLNGENGWVKGITCIKMKLGDPDESGRRRPIPIEGSEFTLKFDTVIEAIGTSPNRLFLERAEGLQVNKWGGIQVNDDLQTSISKVFAGGDSISGGATVIQALGEGRQAAKKIHQYLNPGKEHKWTIKDALETGAAMELESYNLYMETAEKTSRPGAKEFLHKLAEDEKRHREYFLNGLENPESLPARTLKKEISDLQITDKLVHVQLSPDSSYQDILIFAAQREQSTHDFYMELATQYRDTELEKTLISFAKEEIYHKYLLEKEYDDVILGKS